MEKHSLKWLADLGITLQQWIHDKDSRIDQTDIMLIPSHDGKMQLYSPVEGFLVYLFITLSEDVFRNMKN